MSPRPRKRGRKPSRRGPAPPAARIPLPKKTGKRLEPGKRYDRRREKRREVEEWDR